MFFHDGISYESSQLLRLVLIENATACRVFIRNPTPGSYLLPGENDVGGAKGIHRL